MAIPAESFWLDPAGEGTLQRRIQQMIAASILSGRLRPAERMPSTRALARHLGVSRITVTLAYTELLADEYLTARQRSGFFVADTPPSAALMPAPQPIPGRDAAAPAPADALIDWSRHIARRFSGRPRVEKLPDWRRFRYPFVYGQVDATLFDRQSWRLCMLQALGQKDFAALTDDQMDRDDPHLTEFITRHTLPRRGIMARADQVLVTLGAQNALWLAARVLLGPGKTAAIEDPCYPGLREVLDQTGCALAHLDVGPEGLDPASLPDAVDVVFTTPSHQAPTGATMPVEARARLLHAARARGALIVEDDYEFEMAFLRPALPAIMSLPGGERVIYVGSFSKSLFPGLRLGYLVGPEPFIREARALRAALLRHPPGLMQRTAAYFLSRGHFDARIRRLMRAYAARHAAMLTAIGRHGLQIAGSARSGGSSLWMRAPAGIDATDLARTLREDDVLIEPGQPFFAHPDAPRNFYRLAYSTIAAERIDEGVARIARRLRA
jgi:GntR family transcriptional regulator/MocR family aminotransferase